LRGRRRGFRLSVCLLFAPLVVQSSLCDLHPDASDSEASNSTTRASEDQPITTTREAQRWSAHRLFTHLSSFPASARAGFPLAAHRRSSGSRRTQSTSPPVCMYNLSHGSAGHLVYHLLREMAKHAAVVARTRSLRRPRKNRLRPHSAADLPPNGPAFCLSVSLACTGL